MNIYDYCNHEFFQDIKDLESFLLKFNRLSETSKEELTGLLMQQVRESHIPSLVSGLFQDSASQDAFIMTYNNGEFPHSIKILGCLPKGATLTLTNNED